MREQLEIVTASRMQNMVEIRKNNIYFVTILLFLNFGKSSFGSLGVESPHGGAIRWRKQSNRRFRRRRSDAGGGDEGVEKHEEDGGERGWQMLELMSENATNRTLVESTRREKKEQEEEQEATVATVAAASLGDGWVTGTIFR